MPEVVLTDRRKEELRDVASKRKEASVLVLELDGRVVGTVALWVPGSPRSEAWLPEAWDLRHLAFDPAVHGRGLSASLLDGAEQMARASGARFICLHVRRGNKGVAKLYMGRGYERDPKGDLELPEVLLDAYFLRLR
jgi:ribosomal protein S18 acetylase RimI-like enzyme